MDRGVTNYSHPETNLLKRSARHNLLQPEPDNVPLPNQLSLCNPGASVTRAEHSDRTLQIECDVLGAWPEGVFTTNTRTVTSTDPREYTFTDIATFVDATSVSFRINTSFPISIDGDSATIQGEESALIITPLNWTPSEITADEEGIDGDENPVQLLRVVSPKATRHELTTSVRVVKR